MLALTGLAAECAAQLDESLLLSPAGAAALLEHLTLSFDAPPAVKLKRATAELQDCRRGTGTVAAFLVKFRTAVAHCATAGAPLPDSFMGGLLLSHFGLSHEQQVLVQVTASASAADPSSPSMSELAAALDRLHGHVAPPPLSPAVETITLTASEHAALLTAGLDRSRSGPLVCWHCHKEGHVRFHCPERIPRDPATRPATPPLSHPAAAGDALPRPTMVVSTVATGADAPRSPGAPRLESGGAAVLSAVGCPVGVAIVDSGATATVAGADWMHAYLAALPASLRVTARVTPAAVLFRFGDKRTTLAAHRWDIPISLGGVVRRLGAHVVPGDLQLLLSRPALRVARAVLDFEDDSLWLKDLQTTVPLGVDAAGHLTVCLLPPPFRSALSATTRSCARRVPVASPPASGSLSASPSAPGGAPAAGAAVAASATRPPAPSQAAPTAPGRGVMPADGRIGAPLGVTAEPSPAGDSGATAVRPAAAPPGARLRRRDSLAVLMAGPRLLAVLTGLHRTYAHPGADRLLFLLKEAGCADPAIAPTLRRVSAECSACRAARPRPPRAVVTLPRPTLFNDTVAVDLAELSGRGRFLHVIDLGTRLSRCVVVGDKEATTIVRALLSHWICVYGAMRVILSDPGREFHNALLRVMAERFNIHVDVTAGQSAWSNGVCERHNGVIKHMVATLASDYPTASLQELLDHACFAKNSLAVHGCASPFQLTTGSSPRLPSVLSDAMPAMQHGHLPTEADLARTIALLAASRAAFSRAEASQSVRRALNRRAPGDPGRVYAPGAVIRYWEESQSSERRGMHGPATVVSQTGRVVRFRHGGEYKTRNASDVEFFTAPDPAPSPSADTGVVGAALSALRHAVISPDSPAADVAVAAPVPLAAASGDSGDRSSPVSHRAATSAVAFVVDGVAMVGRGAGVPADVLSAGAALVAASDRAASSALDALPLAGVARVETGGEQPFLLASGGG